MRLSAGNLIRGVASDGAVADSASSTFRTRREKEHLLPLIESVTESLGRPITILDVGGRIDTWRRLAILDDDCIQSIHITNYIDLTGEPDLHPKATIQGGVDARQLPFEQGVFDLIYCNSVIEHVGDLPLQQTMVHELERVAAHAIYLQTPNKFFVVDPHFSRIPVPYFQWLPLSVRALLLARLPIAQGRRPESYGAAKAAAAEITLLGARTLMGLFDARFGPTLRREKFLRLTKSLMVIVDKH